MNPQEYTIDLIRDIRVRNNDLWMEILRIALENDPDSTREVLIGIQKNDVEISKWLVRL